MHDLTKEEKNEAAAQNWGLFHVYDTTKEMWVMTVLPINFSDTVGAMQALNHVVSQAKFNHSLSLKVLRLMAQFNAGSKK
jgi:hypothetical protein